MKKAGKIWLKRSERSEVTRRHILEAATRLFARHGFDRTSTATIAKEAGVSQGIIFHYFETKKKLFWTLVFEGAEGVNDQEKVVEKVAQQADPAEKLRLIGKILAQRAEKYPDLNEILARHTLAMDLSSESVEVQRILEKLTSLEAIFEESKATGAFKAEVDAQIAAITLIGIFNINYLKWNMLGRKGSLEDTVQKAFDMFLSGVVAKK